MSEAAGSSQRWSSHPLRAWSIRGVVVVGPLLASFVFVYVATLWLHPPPGSTWLYWAWRIGISAAATVVLLAVDRVTRRLLPLAALLQLSLVFPDEAPSRFKTALKSGSVASLRKRLQSVHDARTAGTPQESAERLLELVAALNLHDRLTRGHSERVRAYSVLIGEQMGLGKKELDLLNWSALLHDIGKLEVPSEILTKPGKPTDEEWQTLRKHPLFGEALTAPLSEWLDRWHSAIGTHHERWDGKGYPRGLSGIDIPLAGRIVAIADSFDVITSARSYKAAGNSEAGRTEIARCAGAQFDPRVVRAFLNVSLGRMRLIMGPLSWLSHAPLLGRLPLTPALGTLASAVAVVSGAAATGVLAAPATGSPHPAPMRAALVAPIAARALARPQPHVQVERTTSARSNSPHKVAGEATGRTPPTKPSPRTAPGRPHASSSITTPPAMLQAAAAPPALPPVVGASPTPRSSVAPPATSPPQQTSAAAVPTSTAPASAPAATHLAFTSEPPATTTAGATLAFAVSIEDTDGNIVSGDESTTVTVSLGEAPPSARLSCGPSSGEGPVTVVNGSAQFVCSLTAAGNAYTLTATSSPAYGPATSTPFAVIAAAPSQLVFATQPTNTVAGTPIDPAVEVAVEDRYGNLETGDDSTAVTVALATNPGAGALGGPHTTTARAGLAVFANLTVDRAASGYALSASSNATPTGATSGSFDVSAASAAQLVFTSEPTSTVSGLSISPAVAVAVEDSYGNRITTDSVTSITVALAANPGSATLVGNLTSTVSNGLATFSNLSIDQAANGYTLTASSNAAYGTATSSAFAVTAAAATQLVFVTQPTTTAAGTAISPAVRIAVVDSSGDTLTSDNSTIVTITLGANPAAGVLAGTLTETARAGIATFSDLSLDRAASGYTLTATSGPGGGSVTSGAFDVTAAATAQLVFTTQPTTTTAGATLAPTVEVAVEDSYGNRETSDDTTTVTLALGANPGSATLAGTLTETASGGLAVFPNLIVDRAADGYALTATGSAANEAATSNSFDVTAAAASQLVFTTEPKTTVAGTPISPAVQVTVEDSYGNTVTGDDSTAVTVALGTNPGSGVLSGTLTETASGGIATFPDLSLDQAASGYTLTATSSPTHPAATSAGFDISPAAASQLVFTTQPTTTSAGATISPSVQVAVEDSYGNREASDDTTTITIARAASPSAGTLSGTLTQTASGGTATFADLSFSQAANGYTLTATSTPGHGTATSATFDVTAAPPVGETLLTTNSGAPCTSGSSCTTASISPAAGSTLLILAQRGGSSTTSDNVTSVTGPLTTTAAVSGIEYPGATSGNYLFAVSAIATGASGGVTVNFASGSTANPTIVDVIQLSGNDTAEPTAQAPAAEGTTLILGGASANLTSPGTSSGELVLASFIADAAITAPAGFTTVDTIATASNGGEDFGVYFTPTAQTSTTVPVPGLGLLTGWGSLALEIPRA